MPGFLIPLAGLALGAIGNLVNRRRQQALQGATGSAFGSAINTQPQGPPTNAVSQAATTSPTPPTGAPKRAPRQTVAELSADQQRVETEKAARYAQTQTGKSTQVGEALSKQGPSNGGLGARMGKESEMRARRRNREQQAALGTAATTK